MIYFLIWVVLVIGILMFVRGASARGCRGTCEQGRKDCDCETK